MSFRLYKSQSAFISFITADFFVIKLPPFLSNDVSAQLHEVSSNYNCILCEFFKLFAQFIEESGLLSDVIRCVDVNKNKSLFFKYHF